MCIYVQVVKARVSICPQSCSFNRMCVDAVRRCWQPNSNPLQGHPHSVTQPSLQLLVVSFNTDISIHPKSEEKNLIKLYFMWLMMTRDIPDTSSVLSTQSSQQD